MTPQQILMNLRLVSTILETIANDQNFREIASNPESDPGLDTNVEDARHYVYEALSYFQEAEASGRPEKLPAGADSPSTKYED